jgi:ferritin-like metal-binding protein YciE
MDKIDLSIQGNLNNDALVREFRILAHYEIDRAYLLDQAINKLTNPGYQEILKKIKTECESNIQILSNIIENLGGEAPSYTRDFTGFLMQGYMAIRGLMGDKSLLRALQTDLNIILEAHKKASTLYLPEDLRDSIETIFSKAKKHVAIIETLLKSSSKMDSG